MPGPELTVVVPTFNEAANIREICARLDVALADLRWEVIFVDDDSPDGTAEVVRSLGAEDPRVRLIHRLHRRGLSGACIEGIMSANAPVAVVMDGDLQHDETLIPDMLAAINAGSDVVVGSRYVAGGSASGGFASLRLKASEMLTRAICRLLRLDLHDPLSGFFMVKRPLFAEVAPRLSPVSYKILLEFLLVRGTPLKITELPFTFRKRLSGDSKMDTFVVAEFMAFLVSRLFGGYLSARFILFSLVGLSGVGVHLLVLWLLLFGALFSFEWAQLGATVAAMTTNYFLNNALTFRAKRRRGWRLLTGLLSFYVICSVGSVANVGVATWAYSYDAIWWVAGLAGALVGAVFNYAASSAITWRT